MTTTRWISDQKRLSKHGGIEKCDVTEDQLLMTVQSKHYLLRIYLRFFLSHLTCLRLDFFCLKTAFISVYTVSVMNIEFKVIVRLLNVGWFPTFKYLVPSGRGRPWLSVIYPLLLVW